MKPTHPHLRAAFTLIEVLISVAILSVAIIYVLKVHTENRAQIIYLTERNNRTLEDSLYLSPYILKYHKSRKSAYDLIRNDLQLTKLDSKDLLKKNKRNIFLPEKIEIIPPPETNGPHAIVNEIKLKGKYSSTYWHFKLKSF